MSNHEGDPQETVDLMGDDGVISSIVVPRVWHMPTQPARGIRLRDRMGIVWQRPADDPNFVGIWFAPGTELIPQLWYDLLGKRGPLTEVL